MIESRGVAGVLLIAYAVAAAFILFAPTAEIPTGTVNWMWRVVQGLGAPAWVSPTFVEFIDNVLLFVPVSLLGATFKPRWQWFTWLLVGLVLAAGVEVGQLLFLPGRSAAVVDFVANALGALLGYLIVAMARRHRGSS